jgi:hypothetical protein
MTLEEEMATHIVSWEMARRFADPGVVPELTAELPSVLALAPRTFPTHLLERRRRFLKATGTTAGTLTDRVAVAGSVGTGTNPAEVAALDLYFDRFAPRPGPRPASAIAPAHRRLEACTVGADRWFGRARSGRVWPLAARTLAIAGETKRRLWR